MINFKSARSPGVFCPLFSVFYAGRERNIFLSLTLERRLGMVGGLLSIPEIRDRPRRGTESSGSSMPERSEQLLRPEQSATPHRAPIFLTRYPTGSSAEDPWLGVSKEQLRAVKVTATVTTHLCR